MKTCPHCGTPAFEMGASYCYACSLPLYEEPNYCDNEECIRHKSLFAFFPIAKVCDRCGKSLRLANRTMDKGLEIPLKSIAKPIAQCIDR